MYFRYELLMSLRSYQGKTLWFSHIAFFTTLVQLIRECDCRERSVKATLREHDVINNWINSYVLNSSITNGPRPPKLVTSYSIFSWLWNAQSMLTMHCTYRVYTTTDDVCLEAICINSWNQVKALSSFDEIEKKCPDNNQVVFSTNCQPHNVSLDDFLCRWKCLLNL